MPLLSELEHHGYWPEYGTLVVRDVPRPDQPRPQVGELLAEHATDAQPSGSLARAGDGWVQGVAADSRHTVRIEVYDARADDPDLSAWPDALETPFASSGLVELTMMIGGPVGEPIELGGPALYRLQFARRLAGTGDHPEGWPCVYRLRFWPVDAPPEPPRWLRRSGLLVDGRPAAERGAFDGSYRRAITDVMMLALWSAESGAPVTLAGLADRLLTGTETVRAIIEHPWASRSLHVVGDLDDIDAPLTVTVLARQPRESRPGVAGPGPVPGPAARPATVPGRSMPTRPATLGARSVPARPAVRRADRPENPGGGADPELAG